MNLKNIDSLIHSDWLLTIGYTRYSSGDTAVVLSPRIYSSHAEADVFTDGGDNPIYAQHLFVDNPWLPSVFAANAVDALVELEKILQEHSENEDYPYAVMLVYDKLYEFKEAKHHSPYEATSKFFGDDINNVKKFYAKYGPPPYTED